MIQLDTSTNCRLALVKAVVPAKAQAQRPYLLVITAMLRVWLNGSGPWIAGGAIGVLWISGAGCGDASESVS